MASVTDLGALGPHDRSDKNGVMDDVMLGFDDCRLFKERSALRFRRRSYREPHTGKGRFFP